MAKKTDEPQPTTLAVFIDRMEDEQAVISVSATPETSFNLPLQHLPPNVAAGDHLTITFALDPDAKEAMHQRVAALQAELAQTSETETNIKL